jgi:hypothetical protein
MIGSIPLKSLAATEFPSGSEMSAHRKRPRDFSQAAKLVIDIATGQVEDRPPTPEEQGKDPAAAALGRKGGKARAVKMSLIKSGQKKKPRESLGRSGASTGSSICVHLRAQAFRA